jgi:hypothetical protein
VLLIRPSMKKPEIEASWKNLTIGTGPGSGGAATATADSRSSSESLVAVAPGRYVVDLTLPFGKSPPELPRGEDEHVLVLAPVHPFLAVNDADDRARWAEALQDYEVYEDGGLALGPEEFASDAKRYHHWQACDKSEKRILAHLAIDRHPSAHPDCASSIARLYGRGLLSRRSLEIADSRFADFVRRTFTEAELDASARNDHGTWRDLRLPLVTGVTALFGLLLQASPDLAAAGMIAPSLAAALPVAARILLATRGSK